MGRPPNLLDRWGNPVRRAALTENTPMYGGIRSPLAGYPADGMDPARLAAIMRGADAGEPVRYLELAEAMEERDKHYLGVLGTRKRSVAQIDITVEAASDDAQDVQIADAVRDWLRRDELADEVFDILDCLGKGVSFTRIDWERSEGQWRPLALTRWDPRLFRFDPADLTTPRMVMPDGRTEPLEPFRFIYAAIAAKSGLPLRGGLARVVAWSYMFKAFTQLHWTIFTQTYAQPLRLGRWHPGASEDEKEELFKAVANIAGDCAAIIPEGMQIEFVETGNVGASSDLYERRCDWLDRQVSKAILGQTTSTDAVAGGHAVSREHRLVQEDIETADARALAAILNRDLIRPWVQLEWGARPRYPRLVIARAKAEDTVRLAQVLGALVPLGLQVGMSTVRDRLGFDDPGAGEAVLGAPVTAPPAAPPPPARAPSGVGAALRLAAAQRLLPGTAAAAQAAAPPDPTADELLAESLAVEARPAMAAMLATIEAMLDGAGSLEEFRERLLTGFDRLDAGPLADRLGQALTLAEAAGRADVVERDG